MTPKNNYFRKGAWPGSRDPYTFLALNTISSKMAKE